MHYSEFTYVLFCWTIRLYWTNLIWNPLIMTRLWVVMQLLEFERFSRYTVLEGHVESLVSQMQSFPYIISCRWHLLTSIWEYSVILIIAESWAIWSIHKLLEYSRSDKGARSVRNWSITEFLFIAVGLPQSGVSWMVLLNVCLLTNRNVITYREVTVSVNKTNAMAYTAGWAGHGFK